MTTVRLSGFKELDRALAQLPKATGKAVLRRVAKGALQPMADDARAKAPKDSGDLEESIIVSEKRTPRARRSNPNKVSKDGGVQMAMGPTSGNGVLNYATFVEFGTVDTPAFSFMRAAWDGGAEKALAHVKSELGNEIAKSVSRIAKKRAKG